MGGQTDAGLPYPTGQDLLADTPVYINNLKDAVAYRLKNVGMIVRVVGVQTDATGYFTVGVTDFATLRGVVMQYGAGWPDVYTVQPLLISIASQGFTGQAWYQMRNNEGYQNGVMNNRGLVFTFIAWGDPR
jgi:hypothetical protein